MRRSMNLAATLLAALLVSLPALAQDVITTTIGGGPNNIPALDANLYNPQGVAVDSSGNYYIASFYLNRVFKVNATTKVITVVAGSGSQGYSGNGVAGGATKASLYHPFGVAVDGSGDVYIADQYNCVVREVTAAGTISTIAGTAGTCSYAGDGGKGTAAELYMPYSVALDGLGNLYIGDNANCVVRKLVLSSNLISTYAGDHTLGCGYAGDGGAATSAQLSTVTGVATDTAGNVYIADSGNCVVREVTKSSGKISTIAGDHTLGCGYSGDAGKATSAQINNFYGIMVNGAGTIVTIADSNNQRIRQFTIGGDINTVAGNGSACANGSGNVCGEGGKATSAELYYPYGIAGNSTGTFYIANTYNDVVDSFTVGGDLSAVAGNHNPNIETPVSGTPAADVVLNNPYGIAIDASNNVYIADSHNYMVREYVKSSGAVNFFAGNGTQGLTGEGGAATSAELNIDYGVAKDSSGNVYIADTYNCVVREVNTGGTINLFAGSVIDGAGRCGFVGDGGAATSASLSDPYGVAVDSSDNVYIADASNQAVRKVTSGTITTIAGIGGESGYSGDGGPATSALLDTPQSVAVDEAGNIFIADTNNCRVREINASSGLITTVAGNGSCAFTGDGIANENAVAYPQGVAVDANDNLFISEYDNRVRWVNPAGYMITIAGSSNSGYSGDGGLATAALLNEPAGVALDSAGDIVFSDYANYRVRSISVFPALSTSVGNLAFGLTSVGSTSSPQTVTISAYGPVTISNISSSANYSEADNCPSSLDNGATCTMYTYFAPTASGTLSGNITINDNGYFTQVNTVNLTGQGSAISLGGSPLAFGNETVKVKSAAKTVTITNNGTNAVTMGAVTLTDTTDYAFSSNTCPASGKTLAGGASCTIGVTFDPQGTGAKRGAVVINDSDPSSPQLVGLSGTGVSKVALSPTTVTFPTTAVNATSAAVKITLTNDTGGNITLGNPAVTVTGQFVNGTGTTCTADLIIAASGTCVVDVQFHPTAIGFTSGTVSVADSDPTTPQSVALQGYGTGIKFTPGSVVFGTVTDGSEVSSSVTITNVGPTPVYFTGAEISGANSADFSVNYADGPPCGNSSGNPLQPGATCEITVFFDPSTSHAESATYKVFDNSVGSPQSLPLSGTGQP
jgi:hypothetical protein